MLNFALSLFLFWFLWLSVSFSFLKFAFDLILVLIQLFSFFSLRPLSSNRQHYEIDDCLDDCLRFEHMAYDIWRVTNADYLLTYLLNYLHFTSV